MVGQTRGHSDLDVNSLATKTQSVHARVQVDVYANFVVCKQQ